MFSEVLPKVPVALQRLQNDAQCMLGTGWMVGRLSDSIPETLEEKNGY